MKGKLLGGRYQIGERIGGGGMASVYEGIDLLLDRPVAIKILSDALSHENQFVRRFIEEARAVAKLSHPNIVSLYDVGNEGNIYYMVMELIEGESLDRIIAREGVISPKEAMIIALQICDGLAHAHHQHHIIHRDVKPHNILATYDGHFKLADFGIARSLNAPKSFTQTGSVVGSAHYFSPEQARGEELGYHSDLYSLGVVLFEMVTGQVPFDGKDYIAIALMHVQAPVPHPRELNPAIPIELASVIETALEKDPKYRYATAWEMKQDLEYALSALSRRPSVK